ncbi:MAG: type II secretion system protein [Cellvibrionaceae bacterium]
MDRSFRNKSNNFISDSGFTLLELIVVIAIVALLGATSLPFYFKTVDRTERITVQVTANRFASVVGLLRSEWIVNNSLRRDDNRKDKRGVELDGAYVLFNSSGWPFATVSKNSIIKTDLPAVDEINCENLWTGLIQSDTGERVQNSDNHLKEMMSNTNEAIDNIHKKMNSFLSLKMNDETCRYRLITKRNSNYYFDYNLMDGRIISAVELLE